MKDDVDGEKIRVALHLDESATWADACVKTAFLSAAAKRDISALAFLVSRCELKLEQNFRREITITVERQIAGTNRKTFTVLTPGR